ncbi:MAG: carbon monoxide dehydrogenase [Rhodospirillales bacterium]|nr:MAG: carbon monoxide dehydrogenase [Rhodospirillales bacterium]
MRMEGQQRIVRPPAVVWAALNDPDTLKHCIPGCESLEKVSDSEFRGVAVVRVGPVQARFRGTVTLSDVHPPHRYRIRGEGQGGAAGFARGGADVRLDPEGEGTLLSYVVDATVGGKLAQVGSRLVDQAARQLAAAFFTRLDAYLSEPAAPPEISPAKPATPPAATRLLPVPMWIVLAIAIAVFALYLIGVP